MPDWFYRPVAQRALFWLPDGWSRAVGLGVIGGLGKSTPGRALIDFFGHMDPDPRLAVEVGGTKYSSPIGLGWRVDPERRATRGLARFGVGCVETRTDGPRNVFRSEGETLTDGGMVKENSPPVVDGLPMLRRWESADGDEWVELPSGLNVSVVPWDENPCADAARAFEDGVMLQVGVRRERGGWLVPAARPKNLAHQVRVWREKLPVCAIIVVAGGVDGPEDAVALVEAGASLVLVDAGLVYRGPGLIKRCNEALLLHHGAKTKAEVTEPLFRRAWVWSAALGAAMVIGGAATLGLAATRVLLPYDEHYLGITADALERNSPRLFAFMAHDRGTLAGTMLGLGWLYFLLGWHAVRRGVHGAKTAVAASALTGFASFFSFFGFGYFDTLHAFVAVVLFQITVQIMTGVEGGAEERGAMMEVEDAPWRRALWGQLLWVIHAVGLLIAGCVILGIGMTSVFVSEDLAFLCLSEAQAQQMDARMIAVVAHDRATLGGMLLASGVAMLLPVLWCFRRGATWLWSGIDGLGVPAYAAAIGVHLWVGYTDWRHLAPAFAGLALWAAGLGLSRGYLGSGERKVRR